MLDNAATRGYSDCPASLRHGAAPTPTRRKGGLAVIDEVDLVKLLGTRFVARKDVKAFQSDDGAWYPDRTPMTMQDFRDHFSGTRTMGHYLLDQEDRCKFFAFDIDLAKHGKNCTTQGCKGGCVPYHGADNVLYNLDVRQVWAAGPEAYGFVDGDLPLFYDNLTMDLKCMAEGLARYTNRTLGIPVAIATSGHKGLHVYGFTGEVPAEAAKALALQVLTTYGCFYASRGDNFWRHSEQYESLEIEVFPKQTTLDGKDLGNLMKLPLGVHRVTKRRAEFIHVKGALGILGPTDVMEPERALGGDLPWE